MAFKFHTAVNLFQCLQTWSANTHGFQRYLLEENEGGGQAHLPEHMLGYSAIGMLLLQIDGGPALRPPGAPDSQPRYSRVNVASQRADHYSMFPRFLAATQLLKKNRSWVFQHVRDQAEGLLQDGPLGSERKERPENNGAVTSSQGRSSGS